MTEFNKAHIFSGLPHGPFWVFSFLSKDQFMYVHFNHGNLVHENTIVMDTNAKYAMIGTLNKTHLVDAEMVHLEDIAEYQCMPVLKMPLNDPKIIEGGGRQQILSPFTINSDINLQRIMIRSSKIMFYNRVAKTGSQSITELFRNLDKKNDYVVESIHLGKEALIDSDDGLKRKISKLLKISRPMVLVQHYSFIDLTKFGYTWSPDWFNIVREPVEKVISYFYYRRAGWVIAERLKHFPNEKLETVQYYKKDFESCVLKGNIFSFVVTIHTPMFQMMLIKNVKVISAPIKLYPWYTLRIVDYHFSSRLTATLNLCPIYFKIP